MIRIAAFFGLTAFMAYVLLWQECGENPLVFCYRIVWGAFTTVRSCALVPVRLSPRVNPACLNRSFTSSARSTILKD